MDYAAWHLPVLFLDPSQNRDKGSFSKSKIPCFQIQERGNIFYEKDPKKLQQAIFQKMEYD